jgi:serine phosphatase RsbU (regulator of sigma subunit)/PAS domain-containing protein
VHRRALPRDASAVALARRAVEADASPLNDGQLEVARLLVSELVTNAVRHGAGRKVVLVTRLDDARARFQVHDAGTQRPTRREPAGSDGGYGLNLVAALASRWGAGPEDGVWFELDRRSDSEAVHVDEQAAGPLEGARSVLAPPRWSARLAAGVALTLALAGLDIALGRDALLSALLVLPALACALVARWGDTTVVAVLGLGLALGLIGWDRMQTGEDVAAALAVAIGGGLSVLVALQRAAGEVNLRRFRLLSAVADVGNRATTLEEAVDRLLDMLTPAFADACALDAAIAGEERRVAVRPRGERERVAEALADGSSSTRLVLPLRARGRTIGALSALIDRSGRSYSEADMAFAEVFIGRAAVVLDNAGLTSELLAAERQLGTVLDGLAEAVTVTDATGQTLYANQAAVRLLRLGSAEEATRATPAELMGRFDVYDEDGNPVAMEDLPGPRSRAGARDVEPMLVRNVVRATGEERWLLNKTTSVADEAGRVVRVVNVIEDVTQAKRAELAQRMLAEASDALASSFDYKATLQRVAEVAVPDLADWCGLDVPGAGGYAQLVAIAHVDPAKIALARQMRARYPVPLDREQGIAAVMQGDPSFVRAEVSERELRAYAQDEEHFEMLRELGMASVIVVPLAAGGQRLGTLILARSTPGRPFDAADLELAGELGRRAGTAVLNARAYTERASIAATLQRGLRPPELLAPPGFEIASHYEAAGELNEVGGDFYDAFTTADGWMLAIGDVAGHGAEAAALTALARWTLRSTSQLTRNAARAVHQLNATLRDLPQLSLCTAVCVHLRAAPGAAEATATIANCGHPRPLLVRDGRAEEVGCTGPMAGAFDDGEWDRAVVTLRAGDTLVLYTDGVLDMVGEGWADGGGPPGAVRFGPERLHAALEGAGSGDPDTLVRAIARALERFRRGPQRDDTAIAAVRFLGVPTGGDAAADVADDAPAYEPA